jgi:hypothetical protein
MDGADFLPNDLAECQRLLLAAFQQAAQWVSKNNL